ncbi:Crp/Fnr family transcriptional regulator [Nostoc sp. 'Peltigera membranacea cyanobiont' 213]|uniref:family 2B encapsulin nanocompartment shell protein n=1 Tax=Nostoc cyanobionts TaxID=3123326 RepID=UPI000B952160|nr:MULTISPECIES: family 2B encapsulin nanocompartment shell protein [unclassified Nostoc]AVH64300.1 Crp/Fnr family transcriptional regulator [Nostoc sp. 'Peltigera membranacea cyanobiont' N6]OYD88402.1 Crp/Fnr family transcriptional regulator [Nostoc sp. 'Peltigera membranacea cyanobiont' 213]
MTDSIESNIDVENEHSRLTLSTAAARNLSTTTKSAPQMQGITSRWLLKMLPWVQTKGGTYRVNRRLTYTVGDGQLSFSNTGAEVQVIPQELGELPLLRGFDDVEVLNALASRFVQQEFAPGDIIVQSGQAANQLFLIAHGKVNKIAVGKYGEQPVLGVLADGDYFGGQVLLESQSSWQFTIQALTRTTVLALPQQAFRDLLNQSEALQAHVDRFRTRPQAPQNKYGEASIEVTSGHLGETELPGTFVDYELSPREYELSVAQTVLRVSTRVADLYNQPMNQTEQQLRLTIEALRERQEHELINNRQFGLLHNADLKQRIYTRTGPPTPDDLDELLTRRRKSKFFLAHPRTIAAFGRECNRLGIYSENIDLDGSMVSAWRGVPILPCDKIPISNTQTSSILVLRTGEEDQGVIGLHQTGIPDEYQPSLSVRFMGISEKAIISYLVTAYYSAAVLVPDALGILENVEIGR